MHREHEGRQGRLKRRNSSQCSPGDKILNGAKQNQTVNGKPMNIFRPKTHIRFVQFNTGFGGWRNFGFLKRTNGNGCFAESKESERERLKASEVRWNKTFRWHGTSRIPISSQDNWGGKSSEECFRGQTIHYHLYSNKR